MGLAMDKKQFLEHIEKCINRETSDRYPGYEGIDRSLGDQQMIVSDIKVRLERDQSQIVDKFATTAAIAGWNVIRVETIEQALHKTIDLLLSINAKEVLCSEEEIVARVLKDPQIGTSLNDAKIIFSDDENRDGLKLTSFKADIGITGVDYAIAETGSCVVLPGVKLSRLTSLAPPHHLALVQIDKILETLDDLFAIRKLTFLEQEGDMGSYMNFITGPSRTGDIEQTIVKGVHGPKEVSLLLIG